MADKQTQRSATLLKSLGERTPFIGNKSIREASSYLIVLLFLLVLGAMGCTIAVLTKLFWAGNRSDSYNLLQGGSEFGEYQRLTKASIALCGAVIVIIVILLTLYFMYLRYDFEFSERLSTNLSIATQGPDRLRKVAGLLTDYVYPKGSVPDEVRANLANQFIMRLRQAYMTHNEIGQLTPEDYETLANRTIRGDVGFVPGGAVPTAQEYDQLRAAAQAKGGSIANQNREFERMRQQYAKNLQDAHSQEVLTKMGQISPEQRQQLLDTATGKTEAAQQAAQNVLNQKRQEQNTYDHKLRQLETNVRDAKMNVNQAQDEHAETMANLAASKAGVETAKSSGDTVAYQNASHAQAGFEVQSQGTKENWDAAKQQQAAAEQALAEHQATPRPHPDLPTEAAY